jgi:hypothetical protein
MCFSMNQSLLFEYKVGVLAYQSRRDFFKVRDNVYSSSAIQESREELKQLKQLKQHRQGTVSIFRLRLYHVSELSN